MLGSRASKVKVCSPLEIALAITSPFVVIISKTNGNRLADFKFTRKFP